jgi:hypothetical protein
MTSQTPPPPFLFGRRRRDGGLPDCIADGTQAVTLAADLAG